MNRKDAAKLLPIIKAFSEGKTLQIRQNGIKWVDVETTSFIGFPSDYRIKPDAAYRPFANAEECWAEMLKHEPFGWVKDKETHKFLVCKALGNILFFIGIEDKPYNYNEVLRDYTFADGVPFGVKVEK